MAHFLSKVTIIGIDPGLQKTGWGIIDCVGNRISHIANGIIAPPVNASLATRLGLIFEKLTEIIENYNPDEAAIEETFIANSPKTSLLLGQARGAAMVALAHKNLDVNEYATRLIKKSVVGTGTADKEQIGFMVRRLLPNCGTLSSDSADALAAAITHSTLRNSPQARVK